MLRGEDFVNADLSDADLAFADLTGANLRGAALYRAILSGATLAGTDLRGAGLKRAKLREANLEGSNLNQATLGETDLTRANLTEANLVKADLTNSILCNADLTKADLTGAVLSGADLTNTNLRGAMLNGCNLSKAKLNGAQLSEAKISGADFSDADLRCADFTYADLTDSNLNQARLTGVDFRFAKLTGCSVFGVSAWKLNLHGAEQRNLLITPSDEAIITVDNLEVAQFIYLLLNNEKIRDVINTITSKSVLILGRFTPARKIVLDSLRQELRKRDYLPILFDFDKPASRNLTETVSTLAHIARFVIADITDARSIPQELQRIVPGLPSLPVQPIIMSTQYEYSMFRDISSYPWVLPIHRYDNLESLLSDLGGKVINPAVRKAKEIEEFHIERDQRLP